MKIPLLILLLLCGAKRLSAQIGHHTFGGNGHDYIQQLFPTEDNTFLTLGTKQIGLAHVWLMKLNDDCEVLWEKTFGDPLVTNLWHGHRITRLSDGNFIICGEVRTNESSYDRTGLAIKVDPNGNQIWLRTYADVNVNGLFDVIEQDGGLTFAGWYDDTGARNSGVLMRTNLSGVQVWQKKFQVAQKTWPKRLFPAFGSDVILVGRIESPGGIFLQRIDEDGNVVWQRRNDTDYSEFRPANKDFFLEPLGTFQEPDGSVWITNPRGPIFYDIFLSHYSEDGQLIGEKTIGDVEIQEYPYALKALSNQEMLLIGIAPPTSFVIHMKRKGKELWRHHYQWNNEITRYLDAIPVEDGFILAGMGQKTSGTFDNYEGLLTKVRSDGSILPFKVSGTVQFDIENQCNTSIDNRPVSGWFVDINQDTTLQSVVTDDHGNFSFYTETATSVISIANPDHGYWNICNNNQIIESSVNNPDASMHFFVQQVDDCERLEISITQPDIVRCDTSCMTISVHNHSLADSEPYYLSIQADKELSLTFCSEPFVYTEEGIELYLPALDGREIKRVTGCFALDCDVQHGASHSVYASLESSCQEPYHGPFYSMKGVCKGSSVEFTITNSGSQDTEHVRYAVVADQLTVIDNGFINVSQSGAVNSLSFPADGRTWRVEIYQHPSYPGPSRTAAEVEGCGVDERGLFSIGYKAMRELQPAEAHVCEIHMPNTTGVPSRISPSVHGIGLYSFINELQPMEFTVRVANPLDQQVETVDLELKLWPSIDPSSLQVLSSTHPVIVNRRFNFHVLSMGNLALGPDESVMIRFRVAPGPGLLPDQGQQFFISGNAYFDDDGPFIIPAAVMNYTQTILTEEDPYREYRHDVRLYGGRGSDFGQDIMVQDQNALLLVGTTRSYSDNTNRDAMVMKTDTNGHVYWFSVFDRNSRRNTFTRAETVADGGCIAIGSYDEGDENNIVDSYVYVTRIDGDGKLVWDFIHRPAGQAYGAAARDICKTTDDNYIISGYTSNASGYDLFYIKIDVDGNIIWTRYLEDALVEFVPSRSIPTSDGGLVSMMTSVFGFDHDLYIEKIDQNGNKVWGVEYSSPFITSPTSLVETSDHRILLAGIPSVICLSSEGQALWDREISLQQDFPIATITDMKPSPDGNFVLTGHITLGGDNSADVLLVKIDDEGETIWMKTYGDENYEQANSIEVLDDGRMFLWGHNQARPPFYNLQALLIKADPDGEVLTSIAPPLSSVKMQALLYPNPSSEHSYVILSPAPTDNIAWSLHTMDGRPTQSGTFIPGQVFKISSFNLSSGNYILSFPESLYPAVVVAVTR